MAISGSGGPTNAGYNVLASTNVALPRSNWTVLKVSSTIGTRSGPACARRPAVVTKHAAQTTAAQIREWSPDLNVTSNAAPTFLVHAEDDGTVPVANSVRLRDAMVAAKITVETLLFAHGGHGFGVGSWLAPPDGPWLPLFVNFARQQKLFS